MSPQNVATATVAAVDELQTVDSRLLGALEGFRTRSVLDEDRHIHVTWPQIPEAAALNDNLATSRSGLVDDFRSEYAPPVPGQVATPELNAAWRLVGASDDALGVLSEDYLNAGGSAAQSWHSTWYDRDSGAVVANIGLIDDREELREQITEGLDGHQGVFEDELAAALADDDIPVLGFTPQGDLFVGFDELQVGAGSAGQVSVVISLDDPDQLLSDFGERARAAALEPEVPGSETPGPPTESTRPAPQPSAKRVNCRKLKCVAITYDDGPAAGTEELLDTYRDKDATATFFVLGQQVATYPETARRIVDDGHEIGVHTWDHKDLTQLAPEEVGRQITRTADEMTATTGVRPTLLRPPYGATDDAVRAQARRHDLAVALWSVDTEDWRDRDTDVVVHRAVDQARPGSIILMHDIHDTTVAGAGRIIDGLRDRGFTLVSVTDLLGSPEPGTTYSSRP
ncbi:polysaccharide deacetylase family protein [Janibacter alittae]|uniref:Polysaccharide deacetylase family protein n=1 Tax=Janibacter alittae TaxID=3115209 RepID=A0ABZ2MG07_9MICO